MAINFVVDYTFSPNTTISSSQVNTNFASNAAVWQGLEGLTKSFAALRVDATPTTPTDVAIKSYVDRYSIWRRPRLTFGSTTTVVVESGLDGTSGDIPILFPDGTVRTETSTTHTTFNITRNAVLSGSAQSGLKTGLSEATNTYYALYAVKVTDTSTTWVTVGDTNFPLQANFASLNSAYGSNGWVYLGAIRNGDNGGATGDILNFVMSGNQTLLVNDLTAPAAGVRNMTGTALAATSGSTSALTYTYAAGTGITDIPGTFGHVWWMLAMNNSTEVLAFINRQSPASNMISLTKVQSSAVQTIVYSPATTGISFVPNSVSSNYAISLSGWTDNVLGVGSNPLL